MLWLLAFVFSTLIYRFVSIRTSPDALRIQIAVTCGLLVVVAGMYCIGLKVLPAEPWKVFSRIALVVPILMLFSIANLTEALSARQMRDTRNDERKCDT